MLLICCCICFRVGVALKVVAVTFDALVSVAEEVAVVLTVVKCDDEEEDGGGVVVGRGGGIWLEGISSFSAINICISSSSSSRSSFVKPYISSAS